MSEQRLTNLSSFFADCGVLLATKPLAAGICKRGFRYNESD